MRRRLFTMLENAAGAHRLPAATSERQRLTWLAPAAAVITVSVTFTGLAPSAHAKASAPSAGSARVASARGAGAHAGSSRGVDVPATFAAEAAAAVRSARKPMSPVSSSGGASVFGAAAPDVVTAGHHFYIGRISLNNGAVLKHLAAGVAPGRLGLKQASRATITAPARTATRYATTVYTDAVVRPDAAGPTTRYPPAYVDPSSPR
jgi:hypothetical protein